MVRQQRRFNHGEGLLAISAIPAHPTSSPTTRIRRGGKCSTRNPLPNEARTYPTDEDVRTKSIRRRRLAAPRAWSMGVSVYRIACKGQGRRLRKVAAGLDTASITA